MIPIHLRAKSWALSLWTGALGGILLGLLGGGALILAIGDTPPVTIREAREIDGVPFRGGRLDLLQTIDRTRDCAVSTSRYLWRWIDVDGEQIRQFVPLETSSSASTPIGESKRVMLSLALPYDLPEGEWFYWSRSTSYCSGPFNITRPVVHQTPNVPVRITGHRNDAENTRP